MGILVVGVSRIGRDVERIMTSSLLRKSLVFILPLDPLSLDTLLALALDSSPP